MDLEKVKTTINKNIDDITKAGHEPTRWLEAKKELEQYSPHIYETTIHKGKEPSEYNYINWDVPIDDKHARMVISQINKEFPWDEKLKGTRKAELLRDIDRIESNPKQDYTAIWGSKLYEKLYELFGSQQEASAFLNRAGISGIKYPTGSLSGIKGSKEYNYVVFNPEDITIESVK